MRDTVGKILGLLAPREKRRGAMVLALDEFTFRFNRRSSGARGLLFYRLIEQAAEVPYTSTAQLYHATGRGPLSAVLP